MTIQKLRSISKIALGICAITICTANANILPTLGTYISASTGAAFDKKSDTYMPAGYTMSNGSSVIDNAKQFGMIEAAYGARFSLPLGILSASVEGFVNTLPGNANTKKAFTKSSESGEAGYAVPITYGVKARIEKSVLFLFDIYVNAGLAWQRDTFEYDNYSTNTKVSETTTVPMWLVGLGIHKKFFKLGVFSEVNYYRGLSTSTVKLNVDNIQTDLRPQRISAQVGIRYYF